MFNPELFVRSLVEIRRRSWKYIVIVYSRTKELNNAHAIIVSSPKSFTVYDVGYIIILGIT